MLTTLQLEENFNKSMDKFLSYTYSITKSVSISKDIMQNVFVSIIKKQNQYDGSLPFMGWAMGFLKMEILHWRTNNKRNKLIFSEDIINELSTTLIENSYDDETDFKINQMKIAMSQINPFYSKVLTMKYLEDKKIKEIAIILGKDEGSIEMALSRGRRELREKMLKIPVDSITHT